MEGCGRKASFLGGGQGASARLSHGNTGHQSELRPRVGVTALGLGEASHSQELRGTLEAQVPMCTILSAQRTKGGHIPIAYGTTVQKKSPSSGART